VFILFKILKNYETLVYSAFTIFLSVIQTIVITKYFVQKDYGSYGFYISLSQVILILTNWGYTSWGVNEICKKSELNLTVILNKIIVSKFIIGGISLIALLTYIIIDSGDLDFVVISAFLFYYLSIVFSLDILYISLNKVDAMVKISLVSKFLYTILFCFTLLFFKVSHTWLFMLFAVQSMTNSLFLYLKQSFFKLKVNLICSKTEGVILESGPNFILVFSSFLFASGPVICAGHFLSKDSFAVVYASTAIVKLVQASYQPLINKILPKLNMGLAVEVDVKLALFFAIVATITLYLSAPLIVEIIFNNNYTGVLPAIRLFTLSIVPGIMSTIIISQWAVYTNNLRSIYVIVAFVAAVNFVIYILFKTSLTWQFFIWSMLLSEIFLFCLVFILKQWKQRILSYGN